MRFNQALVAALLTALLSLRCLAAEPGGPDTSASAEEQPRLIDKAARSMHNALENALGLIGVRYKRGGTSPETGFDCSGFVGHVFREGLGFSLPRSAKEISQEGDKVKQEDLKPGDLVFFNTMRRTFSHVGIYLGGGLFVHSPRAGGAVRVEDMTDRYWVKRYNGARRVEPQ